MYLSVVFLVYKVALRDALLPISKDKATHCALSFADSNYSIIHCDRPIAVFCEANQSTAQLPPLATLGSNHWIPIYQLFDSPDKTIYIAVVYDDTRVYIDNGNEETLALPTGLWLFSIVRSEFVLFIQYIVFFNIIYHFNFQSTNKIYDLYNRR